MMRRHSNWTNLQDYLGLNEGAGQEMGSRVYGDIEGQAQKAAGAIGSASNRFEAGAEAGTLTGPGAAPKGASPYTADQARAKAQEGYSGPNSLSDIDANLSGQVADAVQRVQNAQNSTGLGREIQKTYGNKAATGTGGNALDSFLTGATSASSLSGLDSSYGKLQDTLGLAEEKAGARAARGEEESSAAAERWGAMAPELEAQARQELIAKMAAERARKQQNFDIALQQEEQYGRGNSTGGHEVHHEDPRLRAYKEGWGEEYDRREREANGGKPPDYTGAADYQGNSYQPTDNTFWENQQRGAPQPYGAERERQLEAYRRRFSSL